MSNNVFVFIRGETEVDALRLATEVDVRFDVDLLALVGYLKLLHEGFVLVRHPPFSTGTLYPCSSTERGVGLQCARCQQIAHGSGQTIQRFPQFRRVDGAVFQGLDGSIGERDPVPKHLCEIVNYVLSAPGKFLDL